MRRSVFIGCGVAALAFFQSAAHENDPVQEIAFLEHRYGGRLGVSAIEAGSSNRILHRAHERFAMCSTFKFLAAAAVLSRVDEHRDTLRRRVPYAGRDLLDYSPVTRANVNQGSMALADLCAAAVEDSDNAAGNLLLASIGGPAGLTRYVRSLGDRVTRLDRIEPDLNTAKPGDVRDTTSPAAMTALMDTILVGNVLAPSSRDLLEHWMRASSTGAKRLRASIPGTWPAGDKTGSGGNGTCNDIAIVRPPDRPPLLAAVFYTQSSSAFDARERVVADVGRIIVRSLQGA